MKRICCRIMLCTLLILALAGCKSAGDTGKKGSTTPQPAPTATAQAVEGKTLRGVINRIDDYLILLTEDEVYQPMAFGKGVTMDGFEEGDKVEVTYTGELNSVDADPVIVSITKIG